MPTLGDHLEKRRTRRQKADAIAQRIFVDEVENKAAKILLQAALDLLDQKPDALPVLTVQQRIRTFLERHP